MVSQHKHLGIVLDSCLSWSSHVDHVCKRTSAALGMLRPHCSHLSTHCKSLFYRAYILPIFDYAEVCWSGLSRFLVDKLEVHQRNLLKILFGKGRLFPSSDLYDMSGTGLLSSRRSKHLCFLVHKILLGKVPAHMSMCNWFAANRHSTRNCVSLPITKSSLFLKSPPFVAYSSWMTLPQSVKSLSTLPNFKASLAEL